MLTRASNASLPGQGFWGRFKTPKGGKEVELKQSQVAFPKHRLLTLAFADMETVGVVRISTTLLIPRS